MTKMKKGRDTFMSLGIMLHQGAESKETLVFTSVGVL